MSAFRDEMSRGSTSPFVVWGRLLLDDPGAGVDDLLSGRGARGAQQRAEPEDFLADLLAHPAWQEERTRLIAGLDTALLSWIEERFSWSLSDIDTFGTRAYAAQISDALAVAARLPLKDTAQDLIRDQAIWDNRFRGLRWPGDIDLLRQFNLVLARHQSDTRFVSRWFATCDDAAWGSPHWQTDLNTGLLGLRKLPETAGAEPEPERRVAAALARFGVLALERGVHSLEIETTIRRRAAALTVLYPRHEGHWRDVWSRVLEDLPSSIPEEASAKLAHWLDHLPAREGAGDVQPSGGRRRMADRAPVHRAPLPEAESRHRITRKIKKAEFLDDKLGEEVRKLIREHWLHASVSGETYFAVRTTHNLYDRLLRLRRLRPTRAHLDEMHVRTLQAVRAEPGNPYIWDLWAKVLSESGRDKASLSVRWESVRRFPDGCVIRNSLAEALREHDRMLLAEHLLRETMRDFPDNEVCRGILAKLLISTERKTEAEGLLQEAMQDFPSNEVFRNMLNELSSPTERQEDRDAETDAATEGRPAPEQAREQEAGHGNGGVGSAISAYLDHLAAQVPLLETYFAPSASASDAGAMPGTAGPGTAPHSELELVAAHRAGMMEGSGREHLKTWVKARPSSYSARLLLAWRGQEGNGLDKAAMSGISSDFPENRHWNKWLCYGFASGEERGKLRREAMNGGDGNGGTSWWGRMIAVYPDLKTNGEDQEGEIDHDPAAMRRLLEDVAFAGADRTVPSIPIP